MKHIREKILLFVLSIIMIFTGNTYATEELKGAEKSVEFEKWEKLSDEDRANSIEPQYQTIKFKDSVKRSTYNNLLNLRTNTQNDYYSLKDDINIRVKNQDYTNACWAFSFSSLLETTYEKTLNLDREYSPMHLELKSAKMFNREIDDGGNAFLSVAYATSGNGPVLETDMPISSAYSETDKRYVSNVENLDLNKTVTGRLTEARVFPSISKTYLEGQVKNTDGSNEYTQEQVNAIRNLIKQSIKEYGAVSAQMYSDIKIDQGGTYISDYFNPETGAYYCDDTKKDINHAVTIVGWQDDYPASNFKSGKQPSNNGAYIVLNSYGTEFGNGRIYVYIL